MTKEVSKGPLAHIHMHINEHAYRHTHKEVKWVQLSAVQQCLVGVTIAGHSVSLVMAVLGRLSYCLTSFFIGGFLNQNSLLLFNAFDHD